MGYNLPEPKTFINIKLTDAGRRQLSLGQLTFFQAVLSDREINYGFDRTDIFNIADNRILSPVDVQPIFSNFDGTNAVTLTGQQVTSAKQFTTGATITAGFFTGATSGVTFAYDFEKYKGRRVISYTGFTPDGSTTIDFDAAITGFDYVPIQGDLVYVKWEPIQSSGTTYIADDTINSGNPTNALWYAVTAVTGSDSIDLDRAIPNFGPADATSTQHINAYFYPYGGLNAIETYYGSASTVNTSVWNMNIVRTNSIPGTPSASGFISGYTSYGSMEYNGTKQYLGFSAETPAIGIVHFTNSSTGNTYAEQFIEGSVQLTIPNVMWHNIGADNGQGIAYGIKLYDVNGSTYFDSASQSTYRNLQDSVSSTGNIVGRVYHKLQIVVITDQELLTALSYKSNRIYTLPKLNLNLVANPKFPLTSSQATGLCTSGTTYFVTYATSASTVYSSGSTYGYGQALHCSYISKIDGQVDINGNAQFLSASFPLSSFPYLRNSNDMQETSSLKGTGWNANSVQILINAQPTSFGYDIDTVPANAWSGVSLVNGNGIYNASDVGDLTIDALKLANFNFIISAEDVTSGSTYVLNDAQVGGASELTFGDESFFFGSVDTNILATTYKSVMTVFAANDQFDTSVLNPSFDDVLDTSTYITEIGILDNAGNLVAVGKPTYPILKNNGRYLAFQLEIDF